MSTYEELTLIVNVAMLVVAILVYANGKGTKNQHGTVFLVAFAFTTFDNAYLYACFQNEGQ